ncbi:MAG: UDP-2,3-diacylglucosamine diphosphatase [Bdellovibrionales bacterium]|nr:UDP-2,3-diacylglucosamine diphosphatase [Bdellovibrionales bacterium]
MNRALFVSDIHISSPEDPKHGLFLRLLDKLKMQPPGHFFMVGDIFDLWIADRPYFVERFATLIEKIRELRAQGWEIHYFEGNHDLDLRRFWQHKLGVDVQDSAAFYQIAGKKLRVEHGDQMDPTDRGYLFLRWFLRTPLLRFLGRYLPNALVAWIGERASHASRDYTSNVKTASSQRSIDVIRRHAQKVYADQPFDIFVSGHVHVMEDSVQENGKNSFRCFNLGTWLKEPVLLEIEDKHSGFRRLEEFLGSH